MVKSPYNTAFYRKLLAIKPKAPQVNSAHPSSKERFFALTVWHNMLSAYHNSYLMNDGDVWSPVYGDEYLRNNIEQFFTRVAYSPEDGKTIQKIATSGYLYDRHLNRTAGMLILDAVGIEYITEAFSSGADQADKSVTDLFAWMFLQNDGISGNSRALRGVDSRGPSAPMAHGVGIRTTRAYPISMERGLYDGEYDKLIKDYVVRIVSKFGAFGPTRSWAGILKATQKALAQNTSKHTTVRSLPDNFSFYRNITKLKALLVCSLHVGSKAVGNVDEISNDVIRSADDDFWFRSGNAIPTTSAAAAMMRRIVYRKYYTMLLGLEDYSTSFSSESSLDTQGLTLARSIVITATRVIESADPAVLYNTGDDASLSPIATAWLGRMLLIMSDLVKDHPRLSQIVKPITKEEMSVFSL